jgi:hypothetical protein
MDSTTPKLAFYSTVIALICYSGGSLVGEVYAYTKSFKNKGLVNYSTAKLVWREGIKSSDFVGAKLWVPLPLGYIFN